MNKLPLTKRAQIINLLVEGSSLRETSRIADVSINTVTKLLLEVGKACQDFHYSTAKQLQSKLVKCDEIRSFVYAKEKNLPEEMKGQVEDVWTWTALDSESKLIISWLVGDRSAATAEIFIKDVASSLANRVQITYDGHHAYLTAVEKAFETPVDFSQLIKIYGEPTGDDKGYSLVERSGKRKNFEMGHPDMKHGSKSHVGRQNLNWRIHMRPFTRVTNAFSKKLENHSYAIALHFVFYNFVKVRKTSRVTPAMESGLAKRPMSIEDLVKLTEKNSS